MSSGGKTFWCVFLLCEFAAIGVVHTIINSESPSALCWESPWRFRRETPKRASYNSELCISSDTPFTRGPGYLLSQFLALSTLRCYCKPSCSLQGHGRAFVWHSFLLELPSGPCPHTTTQHLRRVALQQRLMSGSPASCRQRF